MKPGRAGTMTHEYKRHGTTTLFAALNVLDGTVIGCNMQGHRHQEFIRFLNTIEEQVPAGNGPRHRRQLCDAQASEGAPMAGPASPLDVPLRPTPASWLNAVEGFFAKLTRRTTDRNTPRLRRLTCKSPLTASSLRQTPIPNPSSGQPTQRAILAAVKPGKQSQSHSTKW